MSSYPIMTYYYPIILDDIPIMLLYHIRTRYSLSEFELDNLGENEVLSICKGFKL
jgi:hypothetical protein